MSIIVFKMKGIDQERFVYSLSGSNQVRIKFKLSISGRTSALRGPVKSEKNEDLSYV